MAHDVAFGGAVGAGLRGKARPQGVRRVLAGIEPGRDAAALHPEANRGRVEPGGGAGGRAGGAETAVPVDGAEQRTGQRGLVDAESSG